MLMLMLVLLLMLLVVELCRGRLLLLLLSPHIVHSVVLNWAPSPAQVFDDEDLAGHEHVDLMVRKSSLRSGSWRAVRRWIPFMLFGVMSAVGVVDCDTLISLFFSLSLSVSLCSLRSHQTPQYCAQKGH